MAFEVKLVANVAEWLKGTAKIEQSIDDVAQSLDELASETAKSADVATDHLEKSFTEAFEKTKKVSRDAGAQLQRDAAEAATSTEDSARRSSSSAIQSLDSLAAAFDGSASSAAGAAADIGAELGALGPAAGAAAAMIAAGFGVAMGRMEADAKRISDIKDAAIDLAQALDDVQGNPEAIKWADRLKASLLEIINTKEWWEAWQDAPTTRLEEWAASAQQFGVSLQDVVAASAGDADALARVNLQLTTVGNTMRQQATHGAHWDFGLEGQIAQIESFQQQVNDQASILPQSVALYGQMQSALQSVSNGQVSVVAGNNAALQGLTQNAASAAQDASAEFSKGLTENLSVADEGLKEFVHKGKLHLDEWAKELKSRARENRMVQDFAVTIAPKLSPEALTNFAQLPEETQRQIAQAYKKGDKGDRKLVVQNLEAEARVAKVNLNLPSNVEVPPIVVPTNIDVSGATKGIATAANAAQKVADDSTNELTLRTRIDVDELQRQVDRAAASIHPPTITVRTKVSKEVP